MSVQITKQPSLLSFSRNPVIFELKSNALYQQRGQPFIGGIYFSGEEGTTLTLEYGDIKLTFITAYIPDDSGLQVHFRPYGLTDLAWIEMLAADLRSNFYLDRDFVIDINNDGTYLPRVRFTAKVNSTAYNLATTSGAMFIGQYAANDRLNPNFKLYAEVWVQKTPFSPAQKISDAYLEADKNGVATIDISGQLTDAMLSGGFDRPDFANAIARVDTQSTCRYFIKYAEVYGDTQVIRQINQSVIYYALLGGISKEMLSSVQLPDSFMTVDKVRFLKQDYVEKYLLPEQAEFLSLVLFKAPVSGLQMKFTLFYEDGAQLTVFKHALSQQPLYTKLTFPVGFVQNNLNLVDDSRPVIKYTVVILDNDSNELTETRTYWLDYEYRPNTRQFIYLSSLGTYDTLVTFGRGSSQYELVQKTAEIATGKNFILADGEQINYSNSLSNNETVTSGYREKSEIRLFKDLALSLDMLLYRKNRIYAVAFASKTVKEFKDSDSLHAISFDFGFRYNEQLFTVDDQDDIDMPMFLPLRFATAVPDPPLPDGSLDYRYYKKTETYNKAEIEGLVNLVNDRLDSLTASEAIHYLDLIRAISERAAAAHTHDDRYIPREEMNDLIVALNEIIENGAGINADDIGTGLMFIDEKLVVDFTKATPKSDFDALRDALVPHPTYNGPSSAASANVGLTGEAGQEVTLAIAVNFTQRDAGQASGYQVKKNGEVVAIGNVFNDTIVLGSAAVTYQGAVFYYAGPVKKNIIGIDDATGQIQAGSVNSNVLSFIGYLATWYGPTDGIPADGSDARSLSGKQLTNQSNTFILNTGITKLSMAIVVAPGKNLSGVVDLDALNSVITSEYELKGTIAVNNAGGVAVPGFKVYIKKLGVAYSTSHRHQITLS